MPQFNVGDRVRCVLGDKSLGVSHVPGDILTVEMNLGGSDLFVAEGGNWYNHCFELVPIMEPTFAELKATALDHVRGVLTDTQGSDYEWAQGYSNCATDLLFVLFGVTTHVTPAVITPATVTFTE